MAAHFSSRSRLEMPKVETLEEEIEKTEEMQRVASLGQWQNLSMNSITLTNTDIVLYMSFTTSIIFLVATFVIQYRRRWHEERPSYFIVQNLTIALLTIQITFLLGTSAHLNLFWQRVVLANAPEMSADLRRTKHYLCFSVPIFLHFIHLACLFWMLGHTFWLGDTFSRLMLLVKFDRQLNGNKEGKDARKMITPQQNFSKSTELLSNTGIQYRRRFLRKHKQKERRCSLTRKGQSNSCFGCFPSHSTPVLASSSSSVFSGPSTPFSGSSSSYTHSRQRSVRCMLNSLMAPVTFSFSCVRRLVLRLVGGKFKFLMHHRQGCGSNQQSFVGNSAKTPSNYLETDGRCFKIDQEDAERCGTRGGNENEVTSENGSTKFWHLNSKNKNNNKQNTAEASMQMANIFAINSSSRLNNNNGHKNNISAMTKHESCAGPEDDSDTQRPSGVPDVPGTSEEMCKLTCENDHHLNGARCHSQSHSMDRSLAVSSGNGWSCRDLIAFAMGAPFVLVVIAYRLNPRGYETNKFCWMSIEGGIQYSFVIPVLMLILVNTFRMLVVMKRFMFLKSSLSPAIENHLEQYKPALSASVILLPFFSFNWFLSILSLETLSTPIFECLFAISNALFAYLFFELHCRQRFGLRLDCFGRLLCFRRSSTSAPICTEMDSQEFKNILHNEIGNSLSKHSRFSHYEMHQTVNSLPTNRVDHCNLPSIALNNECLCCSINGKACSTTSGPISMGLPPGMTLLPDEVDEELIVVELDEDFEDFIEEEDEGEDAIDSDEDSELDFDDDCELQAAMNNEHMFCSGMSQY